GQKRRPETVKESNPAARPGAQSAMRGLTRYFRAAVARKYSVCPRIARQGQSGTAVFRTKHQPAIRGQVQSSTRGRTDISAPQLRGNIPSVPVLPGNFSHLPGNQFRKMPRNLDPVPVFADVMVKERS